VVEFTSEMRSKLSTTVRNDSVRPTMEFPDMLMEELSSTFGFKGGSGRKEVSEFQKFINDNKDSVIAVGRREFDNEVDSNRVPRMRGNGQRMEETSGLLSRKFGLLTLRTRFDKCSDITAHSVPKVVSAH
jgi:hypothetical protein